MEPITWVTLCVAAVALLFNVCFWVRAVHGYRQWRRQKRSREDPPSWPLVHVFVCLKGDLPDLAETVRALDTQDYSGFYRVTFVTEESAERGDEAAAQLKKLLPFSKKCDHIVAGRVIDSNTLCAQKNYNILAGIQHARDVWGSPEVYAFCDGDLMAQPIWLREMIRPIATNHTQASTSMHYASSDDRSTVRSLYGLAETCQSLASLVVPGSTWGGSMAIRASDFHRCHLDEVWRRTVVDDMTMSRALRKSRLSVMPVAAFLVHSRSEFTSYRSFVRWLGRQYFFVKIYLPSLYQLLWMKMAINVATLWLATYHLTFRVVNGSWSGEPLVAGLAVGTATLFLLAFVLYRYLVPERPPARAWLGAALLVPGASLLACADAALRRRRLTWRDITYVLERGGTVAEVTQKAPSAPNAERIANEAA